MEEGGGPGREAYKDFYEERILSSRVDEVPQLLAEILDRLTAAATGSELLMPRWVHPLHSNYVDSLLTSSGLLELREDYQAVFRILFRICRFKENSVAEPQGAASFGRSRSRNAMRLLAPTASVREMVSA
jgi:hypothetical protein